MKNVYKIKIRISMMAIASFAVAGVLLGSPLSASAQWTTNGNHIYSSNTGNVGIGTNNPLQPLVVGGSQPGNAGMEIFATSGVGIQSFNRLTNTYQSLAFDALAEKFRFKAANGTAVLFQYVNATSLNGPILGVDLDMNTHLTATNMPVTGQKITLPTSTNTDGGTRNYYGLQVVPGAITQTSAAGTNNWSGVDITMPAITQTTGTITSTGLKIKGGTVNSGTSYALTTDALAGNVGIGTTTPTAKLDVNGGIKVAGNITSDGDICIGICQ